jgi:hypothetical protein
MKMIAKGGKVNPVNLVYLCEQREATEKLAVPAKFAPKQSIYFNKQMKNKTQNSLMFSEMGSGQNKWSITKMSRFLQKTRPSPF